jgi:SAM-dependent methyltransferase
MSDADYLDMNRAAWDQRATVHFESAFYDVPGFLAGNTSLREIELAELTGVGGRRLLHLQCHFGLDTLSWARLGANCTGVDISPVAIEQARRLAAMARLDAQFVCSDVYGFRPEAPGAYDIVFTSYGAICWLPDLARWAEVVSSNLAAGGTFYMVEFHPVYDLIAGHAYFNRQAPDVDESGTYTENGSATVAKMATWAHPFSDIVNALAGAGILVERLNEFPFSPYDCFEGLVEREPGRYYLGHGGQDVPLVFSLTGRKAG